MMMRLSRIQLLILLLTTFCYFSCTLPSPRLVIEYTLQGVKVENKPLISGSEPAWNPDGKRIAYSDSGIRVYNLETESSSKLTSEGTSPAWSPDGRLIAYADHGIRIFDTESESIQVITESGESPSWSPDAKKIAYALDGIQIVDIETKEIVSLTKVGIDPAWSPDGDKILFTHLNPEDLKFHIWFFNIDRKFDRELIHNAQDPAWSADGKRLTYSSIGIWIAPASAIAPVRMTNYGIQPTWSPDGEKIAFVYKGTIWVMDSPYSTKKKVEEKS